MKSREMEKIREMNDTELQNRPKDLKEELFNLRFSHATQQLTNPMQLKSTKRDIARIKTVMSERARKQA